MKKFFAYLFISILFSIFVVPRAFTVDKPCVGLFPTSYNTQIDQKINVVFYGFKYIDKEAFAKVLQQFVQDGILQIEPTASNKHNFNFWISLHDELPTRETLEQTKREVQASCFGAQISPHTFDVIYVNNLQQDGMPPAASSFGEGATISLIEPKNTRGYTDVLVSQQSYLLLHELVGHALGELIDEYTRDSNKTEEQNATASDGINCFVGTYEQCLTKSPWHDLIGQGCGDAGSIDCAENDPNKYKEVGCYEGCRLLTTGAFRPHDTSIMNEKRKDFFGLVHAREICKKIQEYTDNATGYCYTQFGIGVNDANHIWKRRKIIITNIILLYVIILGGIATGIWYLVKFLKEKN